MNVGARITLTSTVLITVVLGVYSVVSLRGRRVDLEAELAGEAGQLATTLRVAIERKKPLDWPDGARDLAQGLVDASFPWHVEVLDAAGAEQVGSPRYERLRRLLALRTPVTDVDTDGGGRTLVYLEPIRVPAPLAAEGMRIIGALELTRDMSVIDDAMSVEDVRSLTATGLVILAMIAVIALSTRRTISRPIAKMIAGIDDVAKGDLSHVLLKEREDEIGALAGRFNEMTQSLRDARAETRRGVDERLTLEAHLRDTAQLATIGQLAAEIAHEVGTPLNVVTGRARAMAKKSDDPVAVHKNANIIAEQAGRITRIIQRLLDVARRKVGGNEKTVVDVNRLATDTLELLEVQLAGAKVEPRLRLDKGAVPIPGARDQLQQVLLNLFMNAVESMPGGGALEVRSSRVARQRPGLEMAPEQAYFVLEVADTGVGVAAKDRAKIFEAFYTSKGDSGGTGLGLAVAHGIVKDHDGWIELDDNALAGRGTIFRVFLPASENVVTEVAT